MSNEEEFKYICSKIGCRKLFKTKSGRAKHKKNCLYPDPIEKVNTDYEKIDGNRIKCLKCDKELSCLTNFYWHKTNQHIRKKEKKIPRGFSCDVCSKEFRKRSKLQQHKVIHMKNDFICDKCGKCFSRKNLFDKHFLLCNEKLARPSTLDYEIDESVSDFNDNNDNSHEDLETDIDDRDDIDIDLDFSVDCGTSSPMVLSSDTVVVADLDGISK